MSCVWAAPDRQEAHCFQTLWEVKDDNVAAHQFDTALQNDAELVLGVKDPHEKQKRTFVYDVCRKNQLICWWLLWSVYTFGSAGYFTYSDSQSFNGSKCKSQFGSLIRRRYSSVSCHICCSLIRLFCPLIKHVFSSKIPVYTECLSLSNSMERLYSLVETDETDVSLKQGHKTLADNIWLLLLMRRKFQLFAHFLDLSSRRATSRLLLTLRSQPWHLLATLAAPSLQDKTPHRATRR